MSPSVYETIQARAEYLKLELDASEIAAFVQKNNLSSESVEAIGLIFEYLQEQKHDRMISTLLRLSRLPQKEPKTFDGYDFTRIGGKDVDTLKNLPALSALYAHKNLAFIGPPGLGKTHLAMAYGRACCMLGLKTYFLKATELNEKLTAARKYGRVSSVVNGMVKPSCLIIDEVGRCTFDRENTRIFFDIIDRRYNKEGPNCIIFTSNTSPGDWRRFFDEDDSLLCALDRIFDDAAVFMMRGESFRGKKCQTYTVETGSVL